MNQSQGEIHRQLFYTSSIWRKVWDLYVCLVYEADRSESHTVDDQRRWSPIEV